MQKISGANPMIAKEDRIVVIAAALILTLALFESSGSDLTLHLGSPHFRKEDVIEIQEQIRTAFEANKKIQIIDMKMENVRNNSRKLTGYVKTKIEWLSMHFTVMRGRLAVKDITRT